MRELELEEAIRYIHENPPVYLTPTGKVGGGYICPICGSGSGPHRTGIMSDKTETWKFTCFARNCFPPKSDIINIIGAKENLDNKQAMFRAFEIYGITLKKNVRDMVKTEKPKINSDNFSADEISQIKADIKNSAENLLQAEEYLRSRRISLRKAMELKCGFIAEWYHPKVLENFNGKSPFNGSPRLIIPTSEESYLARDVRPMEEIPQEERGYVKQKAGNAKILNMDAMADAKSAIFIVEGEFDLMSISELGYTAIALGSTSMIEHIVSELKARKIKVEQPFVISLDNDKAGKTASEKLLKILQEANYEAYIMNVSGEYKDANEALVNDKAFLAKRLSEVGKWRQTRKQNF